MDPNRSPNLVQNNSWPSHAVCDLSRVQGPEGRTGSALHELCKVISAYNRPGLLTPKECSQILLSIVELMTDGCDVDGLKFASRFLTPDDYEDIVVERNILHKCGYPLCNKDPKGIRQEHQINHRTPEMILPSTYRSKSCTKEHYQASLFYEKQLDDGPLFSRRDVTYRPYGTFAEYELQIALMEEVQLMSQTQNKSLKDVIQELKGLSLNGRSGLATTLTTHAVRRHSMDNPADPFLVGLSNQIKSVKLAEGDVKLIERDPTIPRLDAGQEPMEGDAARVEGYATIYR